MLVVMMVLATLVFALPVLAEGQEGQETVLLDLTQLAQTIISLAACIVSLYLVPWLRSKLTNEQLSKAKSWVQIAVLRLRSSTAQAMATRSWSMRRRFSASMASGSTRRRLKR